MPNVPRSEDTRAIRIGDINTVPGTTRSRRSPFLAHSLVRRGPCRDKSSVAQLSFAPASVQRGAAVFEQI